MQSQLKILFLDDHTGLRDGMSYMLSAKNKRFVFFGANNIEEGKAILKETGISLAIIDLNLGDTDGISALRAFRHIKPNLPVIIYTMYSDSFHIQNALKSGVQGYVTKEANVDEMENAILTVANGGNCYNKAASQVINSIVATEDTEDFSYANYKSLTKSEQEVFALLAQKKEIGEIAKILGKKEKTIINLRSIVYQKLNVYDRLGVIELAKQLGVLF